MELRRKKGRKEGRKGEREGEKEGGKKKERERKDNIGWDNKTVSDFGPSLENGDGEKVNTCTSSEAMKMLLRN